MRQTLEGQGFDYLLCFCGSPRATGARRRAGDPSVAPSPLRFGRLVLCGSAGHRPGYRPQQCNTAPCQASGIRVGGMPCSGLEHGINLRNISLFGTAI